ncbi:LolA family protein [Ructibacterium gallinarum]|uniref:Outer membrane lipoprotein carrier protein LolA n=1 Tax=Ructibacterium gallinarum TaxID=2779355 RepID=A0A9D5LZV6_9FIRM|nr:hypothetical protein [Ructibacterium gallinarum]MBE5038858.1 outer membrane lipoprotein carrier protein LolA [Ructibacterium gallinarum]
MKKSISVFLIVILMMSVTACGGDREDTIAEYYKDLQSFTAEIKVTVSNGQGKQEYKMYQNWRAPDQYRLEVLEPSEMEGTVCIMDGDAMRFYGAQAPVMELTRGIENMESDYMLLTDFTTAFFETKPLPQLQENEQGLVSMTVAGRENNPRRFSQTLLVDADSGTPRQLVTVDADGSEVLRVEYEKFVPNAEIEDAVFMP